MSSYVSRGEIKIALDGEAVEIEEAISSVLLVRSYMQQLWESNEPVTFIF
jgi:hypothetical protein